MTEYDRKKLLMQATSKLSLGRMFAAFDPRFHLEVVKPRSGMSGASLTEPSEMHLVLTLGNVPSPANGQPATYRTEMHIHRLVNTAEDLQALAWAVASSALLALLKSSMDGTNLGDISP